MDCKSKHGLLSYKNGKINSYTNNDTLLKLQNFLFIDHQNRIWIENATDELYYFTDGKFINVPKLKNIKPASIVQDDSDVYWIATSGNGLIKYDSKTIKTYAKTNGLKSNWVNCVFIDQDNSIWIGTDEGLNIIRNDSIISIPELDNITIFDIIEDKNANYWFACSNGLYIYNKQNNKFQFLDNSSGLPFNYSQRLMIDKENSLWVVSYKKGLAKLKNSKFKFFNKKNGINASLVNTICQIDDENILAGFDNGKIYKININTYKISEFHTKTNLRNIRIRNIFQDSHHNLWISTYSALLRIDSKKNEQWQNNILGRYFRIVFEDSKKNIWIGTRNNGVFKISPDGKIKHFDQTNGLLVNLVMTIKEDNNGQILIGTSKGGLSIIRDDKIIKTYTQNNGLSSSIIFDIYIDNNNIIWLATNGGLNCIIDTQAYKIDEEEKYLKNTPFSIMEDDNGYLWVTSNEGIMKVSKQDILNNILINKKTKINVELYTKKDGLEQSECNAIANILKDSKGNMWFPTTDGIGMINPNHIHRNKYIPPVYIYKVKQDSNIIQTDSVSNLIFGPKTKRITFYFCSLSYYDPESNLFQYKLEGYDDKWSEPSKDFSVTYTNLPPGNYKLLVKGCNNDGKWNPNITRLKFTIKPFFYQTLFFKFLVVFIIFGLTYLIVRLRTRRLKIRKKILEKIVKKRTKELTEKNEELNQQNHEIKAQNEKIEEQSYELLKLSIVAKETDNIVMIFDEKHRLIWFNAAYSDKYGDMKNLQLEKTYLNKNFEKNIEKCIKTKSSVIFEAKRKNKKNKKVWLQCTLTPVIFENNIKEFILIESDITRIKKVQFALALKKQYITESILYASNIQNAIFPTKAEFQKYFNTFIIYKPKDIVSGDFYWFEDLKKKFKTLETIPEISNEKIKKFSILALADCTGHGVPGAFMSMLGYVLLNEIIIHRKIFDPKTILYELDKNIRILLKQDKTENKESMDIALCQLIQQEDNKTRITFAGAKLSLFVYKEKDKSVKIIKGDRKTIGGFLFKNIDFKFINNIISLQPKDKIFLTTDGYLDQVNIRHRRIGTYNFIKIIERNGHKPIKELNSIFIKILKKWQYNEIQRDDISLIGIEI